MGRLVLNWTSQAKLAKMAEQGWAERRRETLEDRVLVELHNGDRVTYRSLPLETADLTAYQEEVLTLIRDAPGGEVLLKGTGLRAGKQLVAKGLAHVRFYRLYRLSDRGEHAAEHLPAVAT